VPRKRKKSCLLGSEKEEFPAPGDRAGFEMKENHAKIQTCKPGRSTFRMRHILKNLAIDEQKLDGAL